MRWAHVMAGIIPRLARKRSQTNIEGYFNTAVGFNAMNKAIDEGVTAIGANTVSEGAGTFVGAYKAYALGEGAISIGVGAASVGIGTIAIGQAIEVSLAGAIGMGDGAVINGAGTIGIGVGLEIAGAGSIGMGMGQLLMVQVQLELVVD